MRVVVVGVYARALVSFRYEMLRSMVAAGHEVIAMAPEDDSSVREALEAIGVRFATIDLNRTGLNPRADLRTLLTLKRAFRRSGAEAVLVYSTKAVVYGSIAARLAGVPKRVAMITGAGSALVGGASWRRRGISMILRLMYAVALRQTQVVFFQNPDDARLFRSLRLVSRHQRTVRINGSGVDLVRFAPEPMARGPITFILIGRLIRDKGVMEYIEASRYLRSAHPDARVQLLGDLDTNPSAITGPELEDWRQSGVVEYLGSTDDVRPFIAQAHVCVLPSYGEGMPRSVLEAMAMSRAIITTDVPGCRETVEDGRNGYLVPARDSRALADAMIRMLVHPGNIEEMGRQSRIIAEERFDVHAVNRVILRETGLAVPDIPGASAGR